VVRETVRVARLAEQSAERLRHEVERRTRAMRTAAELALDADARKPAFLRTVTHEVRTPLTSIIGYTDLVASELGLDLRETHPARSAAAGEARWGGVPLARFLRIIRESARRVSALIDDLLDLQRLEAGRLSIRPALVSVDRVVTPVIDELAPLATRKGLRLTVRYADGRAPGSHPLRVWADPERLQQALLNLVANAIKFTEHGDVTLTIRLAGAAEAAGATADDAEPDDAEPDDAHARPEARHHDERVQFVVRDTGPGIPEDDLPHIFDQFTQVHRAVSLKAGVGAHGSGLGLSITKELVGRMRGTVTVASTPGEGTTFTVTLRRAPPPARARRASERPVAPGEAVRDH
jgi:signal transduction histidine kinase